LGSLSDHYGSDCLRLGLTFKIFSSVNELPEEWDKLPTNDIFLSTTFLSALEKATPSNIKTYFVGIFSAERLIGISIIQHVKLFSKDVFRRKSDSTIKEIGKRIVSFFLKGNALVVGNLMHTGQHAFWFDQGAASQRLIIQTIFKATEALSEKIKSQFKNKVSIIALKDFFEDDLIHSDKSLFNRHAFFKAKVQPNMIFKVRDNWSTTNDYVSSFNKKYRRRYRTAIKKKTPIKVKELDLQALQDLNTRVYELYENVSDNAGVNSFKLHKNHFVDLKRSLGNRFHLFGYFIDSKLVGFFTIILNGQKLETYFLGYDPTLQHRHQMYLNMLFDMVDFGIMNNYKQIVFARTAMEIKSSIGAKPFDMSIYLKHTNTFLLNGILRNVVKFMNPVRDWQQRHPFD